MAKPRILRFAKHVLQDAGRYLNYRESAEGAFSTGPHDIGLYGDTLSYYQQAGDCGFISLEDVLTGKMHLDKVNMMLRHDVDGEPEKLMMMCDQEISRGLTSDIFVIVKQKPTLGGTDYDFREYKSLFDDLHREGFGVGLHTVSWAQDDILGFFADEMKAFEDTFGWSAKTFTLHGFMSSLEETVARRQKYFSLTDQILEQHPSLVGHEHKVPVEWFLYDSKNYGQGSRWPLTPPGLKNYLLGRVVMMGTHPEHWKA